MEDRAIPYSSDKQRKFFNANVGKKRGLTGKVVKEFNQASKGMSLPKRKFTYKPKKKS